MVTAACVLCLWPEYKILKAHQKAQAKAKIVKAQEAENQAKKLCQALIKRQLSDKDVTCQLAGHDSKIILNTQAAAALIEQLDQHANAPTALQQLLDS